MKYFAKSFADGKPQSRTAVFPRICFICLTEFFKNQFLLINRNTDPCIFYKKRYLLAIPDRITKFNGPLQCELYGIFKYVAENLQKLTLIGKKEQILVGWIGTVMDCKVGPVKVLHLGNNNFIELGTEFLKWEMLHLNFNITCLDHRYIEQVLDDIQKVFPAFIDDLYIFLLVRSGHLFPDDT